MPTSKPQYRALVVDDMREMRALISKALAQQGIESVEASDGISATNAMRLGARFDVITVDLSMPREHGHKLITDILAQPNPPMVVVITGVTDTRILGDLIRRGLDYRNGRVISGTSDPKIDQPIKPHG
jgi:CheY-like chemotaxis protein